MEDGAAPEERLPLPVAAPSWGKIVEKSNLEFKMSKLRYMDTKIWLCLALLPLLTLTAGCSYWQGPQTDHFKGNRFVNREPDNTFVDHLRWFWEMDTVEWPEWIDDPPQPKPLPQVEGDNLRVTYINQATVLIQTNGLNILTDPIWSDFAGPVSWASAKRIRAPGIKFEDLPKIDIVLISHDHYDHLDIPTLKRIMKTSRPAIIGGLGIAERLEGLGSSEITTLDWWQEYGYSPTVKITFVPARHGSGRGIFDANETLWGGFVIEAPAGNIYFAGDTGFGSFFKEIRQKFDCFRLAILPIGNYQKRWFMKSEHMNPDDAVRVHKMLNIKKSVGMHFATFAEHPEQAINAHEQDLQIALEKHKVSEDDFLILKFGEGRELGD